MFFKRINEAVGNIYFFILFGNYGLPFVKS